MQVTSPSRAVRLTPLSAWIIPYDVTTSLTSSMAYSCRALAAVAQVGLPHPLVVLHRGRRPLGDLPPKVEHRDALGDPHDQLHVVLDQDHRLPPLLERQDAVPEVLDLGGVHPRRRPRRAGANGLGGPDAGPAQPPPPA